MIFRPLHKIACIALLLIIGILQPALATNSSVDERLFKTAFIYNFAKFTQWPSNTLLKNKALTLCTIGNDKLVKELNRLGGKTIRGQHLVIEPVNISAHINHCQLLYIAQSEDARLKNILALVKNKPVLTISVLPNFEVNGGMVQLYSFKGKTQLIINLQKTRAAKLEISSRLLILAKITGNGEKP